MTLDSLTLAVGLTPGQRADVAAHYTEVNRALQRAADLRTAWRANAGRQVTAQQRDAYLNELARLHDTAQQHLAALRALLTVDQQARLDRLDRPRVDDIGHRGAR